MRRVLYRPKKDLLTSMTSKKVSFCIIAYIVKYRRTRVYIDPYIEKHLGDVTGSTGMVVCRRSALIQPVRVHGLNAKAFFFACRVVLFIMTFSYMSLFV